MLTAWMSVPSLRPCPQVSYSLLRDLSCEDQNEPIAAEPNRFMADIDAPPQQQILDLP
jgi:hypothetical protein